jgi:soluble lytic murein transglycosylase-like protein
MREVMREGVRWTVWEASAARVPGAKASRCLIFDSEGIVRRLWTFPDAWNALANDEILALLEAPTPAQGVAAIPESSSHSAVAAAIAAAAEARALVETLVAMREATRALNVERGALLESLRQGRAEMRVAVQHYVSTLKRGGVPPERALVLLKAAMVDGLGGAAGREAAGNEELIGDGVRWGIEAYYAA